MNRFFVRRNLRSTSSKTLPSVREREPSNGTIVSARPWKCSSPTAASRAGNVKKSRGSTPEYVLYAAKGASAWPARCQAIIAPEE